MALFRVSGHFSVGGIPLSHAERETYVEKVAEILERGLSNCKTIKKFVVARQMRPPNPSKNEPDLAEEITVEGADRSAVFETYRNDPAHLSMVAELARLEWLTWSIVVYQIS